MDPALLLLADGRFPAGGHAYSAGVEAAVRVHDITGLADLERYLDGRLAITGVTDAAFAVATWSVLIRGVEVPERLRHLDIEYGARVMSPALRATSRRLGRQLLRATRATWPGPALDALAEWSGDGAHQPLVLGAAVASAGGDAADAAAITLHHLATAVTTAAVRLLGLDPIAAAAVHARGVAAATARLDVARWIDTPPAELPSSGGLLTEVLGQDHAGWDARLFVA